MNQDTTITEVSSANNRKTFSNGMMTLLKIVGTLVVLIVLTHSARSYIDDKDTTHALMDDTRFQVTNGKMNTLGQQFGHIQTNQQWIMRKMDGQPVGPAPLTD